MMRSRQRGPGRSPLERRVARAAPAVAAIMALTGLVAMLVSPHAFAESDSATGRELWVGAVLGLVLFLVVYPLPQLLFGLGLRSGRRGALVATSILAPLWAVFFGVTPLIGAIAGGWSGVAPVAVLGAAAAAVFDGFVLVAALRGLRSRRHDRPKRSLTHLGESPGVPRGRRTRRSPAVLVPGALQITRDCDRGPH
jgi:hypothetical protein